MVTKTYLWDAAEGLNTPERQAAFLRIIVEEGDASGIARAIGIVARAQGMTTIAAAAGIGRAALYEALREEDHPDMATVRKVLAALGDQPAEAADPAHAPTPRPARRAAPRKKVAA